MQPDSYYTGSTDGDVVYIAVRPRAKRSIVSRREPWGLRDEDRETGELIGLEVWGASRALSYEVLAALPRIEGRGTPIERDQVVHGGA